MATYSFEKNDPSSHTPQNKMKDTTLIQMKTVTPTKPSRNHPSKYKPSKFQRNKIPTFSVGGIVMINGHNFDHYKFSSVENAPTLYGTVHQDQPGVEEDKTNVEFITSGEYDWLNKSHPHSLTATYLNVL